jgi:hypothetical protein
MVCKLHGVKQKQVINPRWGAVAALKINYVLAPILCPYLLRIMAERYDKIERKCHRERCP